MDTFMDTCDSGQVPGQCPADQVHVSWSTWWQVHILLPFVAQMVLSAVFLLILHPLYVEVYYRKNSSLSRMVRTYVGTSDSDKVERPVGLAALCALQVLASMLAVAVWIWHTYRRETTEGSRRVLLALALVDTLGWFVNRVGSGCELGGLWQLNAIVDILTSAPAMLEAFIPSVLPPDFDDWLTLHFLRSYSALYCFERARRVAQLDEHTAGMTQVLMQLVLRVIALLTVMAGTTLTLEVLGDPMWVQDSFLETKGQDKVSFMQMVYWIVVTITTVGYGDFAPRTVLTRAFTTVFIVVGVCSIYMIQFSFAEMRRQQHEGTGKYWQKGLGNERHVVVILCHHGSASRMASLIHGFLQELLHSSHNHTEDHHDHESSFWSHCRLWIRGRPADHVQSWPDVVFLSPTKWEEERRTGASGSMPLGAANGNTFREYLEATEDFPARKLNRIWFLVGNITSETDLKRARVRDSALTYVLSDLKSLTPESDDAQTIYTAVVIRDLFPDVRLRLMVMKPESKELAVQAGIDTTRCFSSRELSASLLGQNARCHGLIPVITSMLKSVDAEDEQFFLRHAMREAFKSPNPPHLNAVSGSVTRIASDGSLQGSKRDREDGAILSNLRTLSDLKRTLRKSQTSWCPRKKAYERSDPWMFEYFEGAARSVFGFDLNSSYAGLSYGELVLQLYRDSGVLLLGVQHSGRLWLCPQSRNWRAKSGQVCVAIAQSSEQLDQIRLNAEDRTSWRSRFQNARKRARNLAQREGRHVSAARLIGKRLQRAFLLPEDNPFDNQNSFSVNGGPTRQVSEPGMGQVMRQTSENFLPSRQLSDGALPQRLRAELTAAERRLSALSMASPPPQLTLDSPMPSPLSTPALQPTISGGNRRSSMEDYSLPPANFYRNRPRAYSVGDETISQGDDESSMISFGDAQFARQFSSPELSDKAQAREIRSSLRDGDELIVLIICHGETWQQVRTFVEIFRQDHLPCLQPLIILAPTQMPQGLLDDCGTRIACMTGSCLRAQALIEAGVMEASAVVVMSGEVTRYSRSFDYHMVLTAQELECWLGNSPSEAFTSFELHDSSSAKHLPRLRGKMAENPRIMAMKAFARGRPHLGVRRAQLQAMAYPSPRGGQGLWSANLEEEEELEFERETSANDLAQDSTERRTWSAPQVSSPPPAPARFGGGAASQTVRTVRVREPIAFETEEHIDWDEESDDDEKCGAGIEDSGHRRRSLWDWFRDFAGRQKVLEERSHESIIYDPRFAAGQVFTPELWGMMLGRMFYMPAVIELMEALVMPSKRGQHAYPWQVRVPPSYYGRTYEDLLEDLALGHGVQIDEGSDFEDPQRQKPQVGAPAIPIALYRLREDFNLTAGMSMSLSQTFSCNGDSGRRVTAQEVGNQAAASSRAVAGGIGGHHFLVLSPPLHTLLREGDWVICQGGKQFGRRMQERGLLRGSGFRTREKKVEEVPEGSQEGSQGYAFKPDSPPPPQTIHAAAAEPPTKL